MTAVSPIKAHQQTTVPLLRRPRPPKQRQTSSKDANKKTPRAQSKAPPITSNNATPAFPLNSRQTNDSLYTDTYEDDDTGQFEIYSLYPTGPECFPRGKTTRAARASYPVPQLHLDVGGREGEVVEPDDDDAIAFTLNDFRISTKVVHPLPMKTAPEVVISRQNYLKLTSWFAANVPTQDSLNTLEIQVDTTAPASRKPRHQALLELSAMVEDALQSRGSSTTDTLDTGASSLTGGLQRWPTPTPEDTLFQSSTSRYFCGQGRSNSPFDASNQPFISPSEVAVLQSMMSGGGRELSLKALFLTALPDLTPLSQTLTSLNLSFNSLAAFPDQLLQLQQLTYLWMRNNPLRELPIEIRRLKKLQVFCISFSMLTELPPSLFELSALRELDVSHNTLQWISRDIANLSSLQRLNVDGNQLCGLPATFLRLQQITHLSISDNLTHPLLWRENTRNQPQMLVDLTSVVLGSCVSALDDEELPSSVRIALQSRRNAVCDCCQGVLFGAGLRLIRAVAREKFGVRNLPFIFQVCSPSCRSKLKKRANRYWTPSDDT